MHKKFEMNCTKIKGSCQSGRKVVTHNFKSNLPLSNIKLSKVQLPIYNFEYLPLGISTSLPTLLSPRYLVKKYVHLDPPTICNNILLHHKWFENLGIHFENISKMSNFFLIFLANLLKIPRLYFP